MTEPSRLPPIRDLPEPTADRIRSRLLAATAGPAPHRGPSRWLPLAAAIAVLALVAAAVMVVGDRQTGSPPATPSTVSPTPTRFAMPPPAELSQRCQLDVSRYRYVTEYQGDGAVTWLFVRDQDKSSVVCTWKVGTSGHMANFINDWYSDGMGPSTDGKIHVTDDRVMPGLETGATPPPEWDQLEPDRHVLVGPVPATVTKVVVTGPDGEHVAGLRSGWFVFHYRGEQSRHSVTGYDADGAIVDHVN